MATSSCDGERRRSRVAMETSTGGGGGSSGGGEWTHGVSRRVQVREEATGRAGSSSATTCRPRLARWHSTEQLGCAGGGRRLPCPWWAGWAGWAGFAWAPGKVFFLFLFNLSFLFFFF